jgi:uncharacterized membrane protein
MDGAMMRRWIALGSPRALLLLGSLCLNVLMGSYIAKQWIAAWSPPIAFTLAAPPRLIQFVAGRLPSADAETLWRIYRAKEQELRTAQGDYEQSLRRAVRLLAQPDVDVPALRSAVMGARDKRIKVGDIVIETFLEAIPQLSPQARQDLVGRLPSR